MGAADDPQRRRTLGGGYARYVAALERRAGVDQSEGIRYRALRRLAELHGVDSVIDQLMELAGSARSDWIALRANNLVADYLQLFEGKADQ